MTTNPSKFWNSEFSNNCCPQKSCFIPSCCSSQCYLALLRNIFGYLHQYSISFWSPSALPYSHKWISLLPAHPQGTVCQSLPATKPDISFSSWLRSRKSFPVTETRSCFCRKEVYVLNFLIPLLQEGYSACLKTEHLSNKIDALFLYINLFLGQHWAFALVAPSYGFIPLCCL